jgi:uncharacterized protein with FMN-binding domain
MKCKDLLQGGEGFMTKSRKITGGIISITIVIGLVMSMPLTHVLLSSYPVSVADMARGESHPEWKDGVYTGQSVNQRGDTTVLEVTIAEGRLQQLRNVNNQDTSIVSDKVLRELMPVLLKKNATDIDALSGATVSSKGIIAAVNNAVEQAIK